MASEKAQTAQPKYSWDYDVPDDPFWKDLPFTTARNFLSCYTPQELEDMSFPPLPEPVDKWKLLLSRLEDKWEATKSRYDPAPVYQANNKAWMDLRLAMWTVLHELKEMDAAIAILNEMSAHGTYNNQMSAKNMLAGLYTELGRFAEAEVMGKECLTWLRELPQCGPKSPMALGCQRRLLEAIFKQGKEEEAKDIEVKMEDLIQGLSGHQFEKYQDEEQQMLKDKIKELQDWRQAQTT